MKYIRMKDILVISSPQTKDGGVQGWKIKSAKLKRVYCISKKTEVKKIKLTSMTFRSLRVGPKKFLQPNLDHVKNDYTAVIEATNSKDARSTNIKANAG
jgi:hypothetical protein